MVAAPERIRVNCDLRHVTVVLCCDPKAFTHTNPLDGIAEGGAGVESDQEGEMAWEQLPLWARRQIIKKKIRVFTLPGFQIARKATDRADLQLRMQGNAFLGAFFRVSPLLKEFQITHQQFLEVVHKQYVKKFGRLGSAVVKSNMEVMTQGFEQVRELRVGEMNAPDRSSLRGVALLPSFSEDGDACGIGCRSSLLPSGNPRARVTRHDIRRPVPCRSRLQPTVKCLRAPSASWPQAPAILSKYVARRETPLYIAENCTQCMECIAVCPDTALPNCAQDLDATEHSRNALRQPTPVSGGRCCSPSTRSTSARAREWPTQPQRILALRCPRFSAKS